MTRTRRAGACAAGVLLGALLCPGAGSAAPSPAPAPDAAPSAVGTESPDPAATGSAPVPGAPVPGAPVPDPPVTTMPGVEPPLLPDEEEPDEPAAAVEAPVVSAPPASYVAAGVPATVPVRVDARGPYTLAVDAAGLAGVATVDAGPETLDGPTVLTVRAVPGARLGATGRLVVTVSGAGFPAVEARTAVTVVPTVALAAAGPAETMLTRRVGGEFAAPLRVRNTGATVIHGVSLVFPTGPYHRVTGRFANCWYGERTGWCRFAGEVQPGTTYALSAPMRMRVRPDFPAPGDIRPLIFRWRIGEAGAGKAVRGRGPVLRLVPVGGAGGTGSTRTRVTVRVTGARTADLRALAGEVAGDVGSTVTAVVGARNVGSVFLRGDRGAPAVVAVTPPPGTTVRSVPHGCTVADREQRIYHCVPEGVDPFEPGSEMTWRFRLRIDREDERSGWVGVRASHEEPLLDDNLAPLTVTTASGTGGGAAMDAAGDAGLPVTGPPVTALTAVGLLLVAAGAAMCRVGRPAR